MAIVAAAGKQERPLLQPAFVVAAAPSIFRPVKADLLILVSGTTFVAVRYRVETPRWRAAEHIPTSGVFASTNGCRVWTSGASGRIGSASASPPSRRAGESREKGDEWPI